MAISYQDDNFLFSASGLEAIFSDGSKVELLENGNITRSSMVSIHTRIGTPLGNELWMIVDHGAPMSHRRQQILRLIFISPEQDWRRNQTYAWKLDSAWMSSSSSTPFSSSEENQSSSSSSSSPDNKGPSSWLHWNVQSYIDSAIQVPEPNILLECDDLQFLHFRPIRDDMVDIPVTRKERLVLKNVQFGLVQSPSNASNNGPSAPPKSISPCPDDTSYCSIVDGEVQTNKAPWDLASGGSRPTGTSTLQQAITRVNLGEVGGIILLLTLAILLTLLLGCCYWRRNRRSQLYQQLSPSPDEEDLTLAEEDTYQTTKTSRSAEPRSIVR